MKTQTILSTLCAIALATGSALAGPWSIRNQGPDPLTVRQGQKKATVEAVVTYRTHDGEKPTANSDVWLNVFINAKNSCTPSQVIKTHADSKGRCRAQFDVPVDAKLGSHPNQRIVWHVEKAADPVRLNVKP